MIDIVRMFGNARKARGREGGKDNADRGWMVQEAAEMVNVGRVWIPTRFFFTKRQIHA